MSFNLITLEKTSYIDALLFQETFFNAQLEKKAKGLSTSNNLLLLQHTPVYTLGKSGDLANLKIPIEETDAEFYRSNRGGDITFHGPGQLVGYPIFDLETFELGTRAFVEKIEDCIMLCLSDYGLKGERIEGASGVWIDAQSDHPRKICALGIRMSRGISMHGFAFNINTDLSYFDNIVPCELEDKEVTSLEKELGRTVDFWAVQRKVVAIFQEVFSSVE